MSKPLQEKGIHAGFSCGAGHGHCFWPTGGPVDDRKYVAETVGRWKQAHKVNVDVTKGVDRNRHLKDGGMVMFDDFIELAQVTGLDPGGDIMPNTTPSELVANQPLRHPRTRVGESMQEVKHMASHGWWHDRSRGNLWIDHKVRFCPPD